MNLRYTNYQRPDGIVTDNLYRDAEVSDTTSLASLSWKELFTDVKLQSLIEQGIANNTDLQIAYLKVTETETILSASRLSFLPSVSLGAQGGINSFDGNKPTKTYSLSALADWELDIFGKLRNAKENTKASVESSNAYRRAVQSSLIATIASLYLPFGKKQHHTFRGLGTWFCAHSFYNIFSFQKRSYFYALTKKCSK